MFLSNKDSLDKDFDRLSEKYQENKFFFCKEVKEKYREERNVRRMRRSNRVVVRRSEEMKGLWEKHFKSLMNT